MTIRAKVLVEGDPTALDVIAAALRNAGLSSVEVEFTPRCQDVTRFPAVPRSWASLADVAPDLTYVDWRNEVLYVVDTADTVPRRPPSPRPEPVVTTLRRAV